MEDAFEVSAAPPRVLGIFKKPGPRPTQCNHCSQLVCSHCRDVPPPTYRELECLINNNTFAILHNERYRCPGYDKCDHDGGEMCSRDRYKRRLVCNPCEKNKLRAGHHKQEGLAAMKQEPGYSKVRSGSMGGYEEDDIYQEKQQTYKRPRSNTYGGSGNTYGGEEHYNENTGDRGNGTGRGYRSHSIDKGNVDEVSNGVEGKVKVMFNFDALLQCAAAELNTPLFDQKPVSSS